VENGTDRIRTIPDPQEPVPAVAWPTLCLFGAAFVLYAGSCVLAVRHMIPWPVATVVNAIAGYMMFTVVHEASHHAASANSRLNMWMGHLALPFFAPPMGFRAFRFIHMQHHQHTNKTDGSDPDEWTMGGSNPVSALARWATLDLHYLAWYASKIRKRPAIERRQSLVELTLGAIVVAALVATGNFFWLLVLYIIPSRLTVTFLGWAFDYLPHRGLDATPKEDRFQATRNRVGREWLFKWVLLYQNYHLVHHLHPVVPFYRYIKVWRRSEEEYLANGPALSTVSGRPLTVDEYRQLRHLQDHH